jgi:hypothetical protein
LKIFRKLDKKNKQYKSLYILSKDDTNNKILCNYKNRFLSGDDLKTNSIPSVDMIFIHKKEKIICFVEFKSSSYRNLNNLDMKIRLKQKIFGSRITLSENLNLDIRDFKKIYFVIYNKKFSKKFSNLDEFESWSEKERLIEFNLFELMEKDFINEVFTENCDFLKDFFKDKFNIIFI